MGYSKTNTVTNPAGWLLAQADSERYNVPSGALFEAQAELMQRLSWVNIAVSLISRSAAVLDLNVLKMEGEDTVDIPNHDFERLLWHPNPLQSRFEFLESSFAWRCLTGNSYWWLNRSSEKEQPSEIWIIPANKIAPVPDGKQYIKGYVYDPGDGQMIALEPWEIVHFKSFHPLNPWVGLSPIESIAIIATSDMEMQKWNLQLFGENAARLPGILAFASNINDSEWAKMKQDINDKASKRQIMMLRNTQSGGVQFIQAAVSQKDMEFLASRQATKEEIFNVFGPGLVAMLDKNATEANARSAKAVFTEYTLWPLLDSVAQKCTQDILPVYGEELRAMFDDPRVTDRVLELQDQAEYSKVHTLDEIREKYYGDPPLSEVSQLEADKRGVMLPAQISPTTPLEDEPEPEPQPVPAQLQQPPEAMGEQSGEVEAPETETEPDQDEETKAELARWKRKALRLGIKRKVEAANFETDVISDATRHEIAEKIINAETTAELRAAFAIDEQPIKASDDFAAMLAEWHKTNDLLERALNANSD